MEQPFMHSPNANPSNLFHGHQCTVAAAGFQQSWWFSESIGSQAQHNPSIRVISLKYTLLAIRPRMGVDAVVKTPLGVMKNGMCCGQHTNYSTLRRKNDIPARKFILAVCSKVSAWPNQPLDRSLGSHRICTRHPVKEDAAIH
ncbi:hypothetical protein PISMIDRAFT_413892 [Pisolithus microcarpus 441]|uniref:Uncharacterized protein n=1 Tax=Pisolithus microcarpus 441 TaxID=765257 RepID=A0A0C9YGS6_9AGAM|nr:hypothetical protein PISMIDRAFT_413892 [Pisolithus microcarpus 441]